MVSKQQKGPHLIIDIDVDGSVEIDAIGFKGKACEVETAPFERALGARTNRKLKPEHRQREARTVARPGGRGR